MACRLIFTRTQNRIILKPYVKKYIEKVKCRAKSLKTETRALYLAYTKHRLPWYAKVLAALVISPIDLIPDFIPVLGLLDDLILLPLGIALLIKIIPPEVMEECRGQARIIEKEKLPKNYLMAALVILLWAGIAALITYKIIKAFAG